MEKDIIAMIDEELDRFFTFDRERVLNYMMKEMHRKNVTVYCLPQTQRRILSYLCTMQPGQWISAKRLAASALVDKADVSRALFAMEEKAYVQTRIDPDDRRSKLAIVTQQGREMLCGGNQQFMDLMRAYYSRFLSRDELEDFYTCFTRVNSYMMKLEPEAFFTEE